MNDRELVHACLKGHTEAFSQLVERYKDAVYGLTLSYTHNFDVAQDITQESFIKAFLELKQLSNPTKFGSWIKSIATNLCRMWLRAQRPQVPLDTLNEEEVLPSVSRPKSPCQICEDREIERIVLDAMANLSESDRQATMLFYIDGLSFQQIGDFLGASAAAVKQRVYRARKQLKEEMLSIAEESFEDHRLPEDFIHRTVKEAMARGRACLEQQRWEEAKREFQKVANTLPDRPDGHWGIGLAAKGMMDKQLGTSSEETEWELVKEAFEELSEAYRLGARDLDTVLVLANMYGQFNKHQERIAFLEDVVQTTDDPGQAFEIAREIISSYAAMQVHHKAVKRHRAALATAGQGVTTQEQLDSYMGACFAYQESGNSGEWFSKVERLLAEIPDHAISRATRARDYERIGHMYVRLGHYQEAIDLGCKMLHLLQDDNGDPERRLLIGNAYAVLLLRGYQGLNDQEKVVETLANAKENLRLYEGEWQSAMSRGSAQGEEAKKSDNETYRRHVAGGYNNLGVMCRVLGEKEQAIHFLNHALEFEPQWGFTNVSLAALMLDVRNDRKASLAYLRHAAQHRHWALRGWLEGQFFELEEFAPVREDPEFLAIVQSGTNIEEFGLFEKGQTSPRSFCPFHRLTPEPSLSPTRE